MRPPRRRVTVLPSALMLALLVGAGPLFGHDFWIEPSLYAAEAGAPLAVRLRVGEAFAGEALPRDPAHLERFIAVGAHGELLVSGPPGGEPAGFLVAPAGAWVMVYRSHPGEVRLDGPGFARYLAEEGLERIQVERERSGEQGAPVLERFSRCAKALVTIGGTGAGDAVFTRPVGLPLELVPAEDPTRVGHGRDLEVLLLFGGEPLAGALVAAVSARRPDARVTGRTDAAGRVLLPLEEAGAWLVKSVHMLPAPAGSGADWESLWASLTFEVPD